MNRRDILRYGAAAAFTGLMPTGALIAGEVKRLPTLILIELQGGNDGLNTVIPYADPLYAKMRPKIGFAPDEVIRIDEQLGLHPALKPLMTDWDAKELAIFLGVGYPNSDRSHFRGIQIWDTALDSERLASEGWVAKALTKAGGKPRSADAVLLGRMHAGPVESFDIKAVSLNDPARLKRLSADIDADHMMEGAPKNILVQQIAALQSTVKVAGQELIARLDTVPDSALGTFPTHTFGKQMRDALRLIAAGVDVPVIKISQGSFDTHINQRNPQEKLLRELAEGIAAFRDGAKALSKWDDILLVTYSEFGRRPVENASLGTDHGTAAPHFALGGRVKGGFQFKQPSLDVLANADMVPSGDFRQIYTTVLQKWWGLKPDGILAGTYDTVDFLRA
ncbi:DUF1501 domain-containing protein [Lacibacterium aquatile]